VKNSMLTLALVLGMSGCAGCPTNPPFKAYYTIARPATTTALAR
jgi:hypothetical protein